MDIVLRMASIANGLSSLSSGTSLGGSASSNNSTKYVSPWGEGTLRAFNSPLPMRLRTVSIDTFKIFAASKIETSFIYPPAFIFNRVLRFDWFAYASILHYLLGHGRSCLSYMWAYVLMQRLVEALA